MTVYGTGTTASGEGVATASWEDEPQTSTSSFKIVYSADDSGLIYMDSSQNGDKVAEAAGLIPPDAEATAVAERLEHRYAYRFVKRAFDILISLLVFALLWWVFLWIAIAIKLDSPGPVFFAQERVGKDGKTFKMYKFRSMYQDAEQRKAELMAQNKMNGLMFKIDNDPRITPIGGFLRRSSIDELPQFYNVLRGDMSLVGTRPPTLDEYKRYNRKHIARLAMKPGITGLWQVSGRSNIVDFDQVVALDLKYIREWSVNEDIRILLKTVKVVLTGEGSE